MSKRIALFVLAVVLIAGAELKKHTISHGGNPPPTCPPTGCIKDGHVVVQGGGH